MVPQIVVPQMDLVAPMVPQAMATAPQMEMVLVAPMEMDFLMVLEVPMEPPAMVIVLPQATFMVPHPTAMEKILPLLP